MTSKLRSACDRCHEAKVRCSGEMPCRGCLAAKSLCFYSLSNPLGRPRGTSGRKPRARTASQQADTSASAKNTKSKSNGRNRRKSSIAQSLSDSQRDGSAEPRNQAPAHQQDVLQSPVSNEHGDFSMLEDSRFFTLDGLSSNETTAHFDTITSACEMPIQESIQPWLACDSMAAGGGSQSAPATIPTTPDWNTSGFNFPNDNLDPAWISSLEPHRSYDNMPGLSTTNFPDASPGEPGPTSLWSQSLNMAQAAPVPSAPASVVDSAISLSPPNSCLATPCNCLQQHAELISNIQIPDSLWGPADDTNLSLDKALSLAKQGIEAWRNLVACPQCPYRRDQAVVILALMSIRAIIRHFERLTSRDHVDGPSSTTNGHNRIDTARVTIGSVEVEDEERTLISRLLLRRALSKIKTMLQSLQLMQDRRKEYLVQETAGRAAGKEDYMVSNGLLQTQQTIHALSGNIEALENSFEQADIA